jgi:hypothetical protein
VAVLSGSLEKESDWIYRIFTRRIITVNAKNEQVRKVTATALSTKLAFAIDVPQNVSLESLEVGKSYFASLKVYSAKNSEGVSAEFVEFFQELDVDQSAEDFIKAYWVYPKRIKFELLEVEPAE